MPLGLVPAASTLLRNSAYWALVVSYFEILNVSDTAPQPVAPFAGLPGLATVA